MCLLIDYDIKIKLNKIVCNPLSVGGDPREDCRGADAASVGAARHHAHYHEGMLRALAGQERTSRVACDPWTLIVMNPAHCSKIL